MKETELIKMQKQIASLTRLLDFLLHETQNVKTLATGTFETIKRFPGYEEAIKRLTNDVKEPEKNEDSRDKNRRAMANARKPKPSKEQ